jgi:DNA invertase Pin-like site-specific DNA recombinase
MVRNAMAGPMARPAKVRVPAIAYLRTSSAANVGADKDSEKRQRLAIDAYAKHAGYGLVGEFYDPAVSGADPIETRPSFAAMLERIESNGAKTIIVETANRFARDLMVQEVGFARLQERGITLVAADSPNTFQDDTPTAKLVRQVLGAIAEFDKAMTVAKLRGARDRKRKAHGKCEGRKSLAEMHPAIVREAKRLGRASPLNGRRPDPTSLGIPTLDRWRRKGDQDRRRGSPGRSLPCRASWKRSREGTSVVEARLGHCGVDRARNRHCLGRSSTALKRRRWDGALR